MSCSDLDRIPDKTAGTFEVDFSPLPVDFDLGTCELPANPQFSKLQYHLSLSSMQVSATTEDTQSLFTTPHSFHAIQAERMGFVPLLAKTFSQGVIAALCD